MLQPSNEDSGLLRSIAAWRHASTGVFAVARVAAQPDVSHARRGRRTPSRARYPRVHLERAWTVRRR